MTARLGRRGWRRMIGRQLHRSLRSYKKRCLEHFETESNQDANHPPVVRPPKQNVTRAMGEASGDPYTI